MNFMNRLNLRRNPIVLRMAMQGPARRMLKVLASFSLCSGMLAWAARGAETLAPPAVFDGQKTSWHGFDRYDFLIDEDTLAIKAADADAKGDVKGQRRCIVVCPKVAAPGKPWSWRGCYWDHEPQTEIELLRRGFHVAYITANATLKPDQKWDAWYEFLTVKHGLSTKPAFIGMSRGGEYSYSWATAHPDRVACIYADNPGGNREMLMRLGELARNDVPLLQVCGSIDPILGKFGLTIEALYQQFGGRVTMMIKEGAGHHPHSLRDPKPIADFIEQSLRPPAGAPPGFIGARFTKTRYYSIENSYRDYPEEGTRITCRGPGFAECYDRYAFELGGVEGTIDVIVPRTAAPGNPWVFRVGFAGRDAVVDLALLAKGFHIVTAPVPYNADGPLRAHWDAVYKHLTSHGFSSKPVMEGAGGAAGEVYAWAIENPDKVCCVYAENPVLRSKMSKTSPLDQLAPLAKAGVPLLHVCGSLDPWLDSQTRVAEKRYSDLGGRITVILKQNEGHYPLAPKDLGPVLDFISGNALAGAPSSAPAAARGKTRVACVGASITFGAGIAGRETNCYPARMQGLLGAGYDVRNFGVNGCTMLKHGDSPYWNADAYKEALAFNPDIVVIDLGGNDSKPQNWKYKDEFDADARAMIASFRQLAAKPRVLVCLPMPAFEVMWGINEQVYTNELIPMLRQAAVETHSELVDLHSPFLDKEAWFADHIHPNAEGAALMTKIIGGIIAFNSEAGADAGESAVRTSAPKLPGVSAAMRAAVEAGDVSGAVTVVVTKDKVLHCEATGLADLATREPMQPDSLFWIASMTKPVTAVALLMLQDEGRLDVTAPVAKYIPEFAGLETPSGRPANLTIAQLMTHTSGLGEGERRAAARARTLAELVPLFLAAPMQYEPGARWQYTQSGINTAARIVEIVSGLPFDVFVQRRILDPLGMSHTTFYPARRPSAHLVVGCNKNRATGALEAAPPPAGFGVEDRPPLGNGGLFSTGPDYARFCQMLLAGGTFGGNR